MNKDQWIDDLDALLDKVSVTMGGRSMGAVAPDEQLADSLTCLTFALPSVDMAIQPVDDEAAFHRFIMGLEQDLGSPSIPHHSPCLGTPGRTDSSHRHVEVDGVARSPRFMGQEGLDSGDRAAAGGATGGALRFCLNYQWNSPAPQPRDQRDSMASGLFNDVTLSITPEWGRFAGRPRRQPATAVRVQRRLLLVRSVYVAESLRDYSMAGTRGRRLHPYP